MKSEENLYENKVIKEKAILVAIDSNSGILDTETSLEELEELVVTVGGEVVCSVTQKLDKPHVKHYVGKGKVEEIKELIEGYEADLVVFDDELTSVQSKNLAADLGVKILDRTGIILEIFAGRATSNEGKIQVELAMLRYKKSRLLGQGIEMSRQGGGIGTKGVGEKKLELDRRNINDKIANLNKELKEIEKHREVLRYNRKRNNNYIVSLVGYTNAGKSTILNALSNSDILAEDMLFATLDTTARNVELVNGSKIILMDTVGFIQKLPTTLIKAFKSTLEELVFADVLVHVVDGSDKSREEHIKVVENTLEEIGVKDKPVILVYNKIDRGIEYPIVKRDKYFTTVEISAKTGENLEVLKTEIENVLKSFRKSINVILPFTEGKLTAEVHDNCEVLEEEYIETGIKLSLYCDERMSNKLKSFKI
ncbi:MAG: GTPase HflX [Lachnospirales bacterium]